MAFNFTTAIVVGLDPVGYERRYCFEHGHEAREAFAAWDGEATQGVPGSSARARASICSTRRCADALGFQIATMNLASRNDTVSAMAKATPEGSRRDLNLAQDLFEKLAAVVAAG